MLYHFCDYRFVYCSPFIGKGAKEATAPGMARHRRRNKEGDKKEIIIGQAVSLSGPQAEGVALSSAPVYKMWIEDVNAQGGIYVREYGERLPLKYISYDDGSDIEQMKKLIKKLILEDEVDFLLPPWGTAFLYEAATIANKYSYILIGGAGGAIELKEAISNLPYFFSTLNHAETQVPVLTDILVDLGVNSVAAVFVRDLHGIEYMGELPYPPGLGA